jgi:segregation and condensation protein A
LQEYERYKKAAQDLDALPRLNRNVFTAAIEAPQAQTTRPLPQVNLQDLWYALRGVLGRADMYENHQVQREKLSTRAKMAQVLNKLQPGVFTDFVDLFNIHEGQSGVIVTFMAILELLKQTVIEIVQTKAFGKIHVTKK